jgi:membrane associated rhomboid family serine protease
VLATLTYVAFARESELPLVGASGAVSGVLGAYLVMHPRATVTTLIPLGFFTRIVHLPAFLFLLFWIGLQILSQAVIATQGRGEQGGIAYLAHIGGFGSGAVLILLFRQTRRRKSRPVASWPEGYDR